jgi:DNA topoisomerase-1
MKKLFIVESPGKAKTIKKYLGEDFIVLSTMGHIKDLPAKKIGVEVSQPNLEITYEPMEGKEKVIKEIKKNALLCDEIYLAPDADREGEIIAYHILQIIEENKKNLKKKIYRVSYNEISKKAILESIEKKRDIDMNMVFAQQSRRLLDRLVGYKVSPVLWRKITKGLSAGRVQSVALKMICERELEIKNFVATEYWSIHGEVKNTHIAVDFGKKEIKKKTDMTPAIAKEVAELVKKASWYVSELKDREKKRKPYAPFTTSTLQQAAYNNLHFNVQQTMMIAQKLYEGLALGNDDTQTALITYMRTDSTRISDDAIEKAREYIEEKIGKSYLPKTKNTYSTKDQAQDAHEAIRPIDVSITPASIKSLVSKEIFLLYEIIWNRFVASQMQDAIYLTRTITLMSKEYENVTGKISGSIISFDGFLKVYQSKEIKEEEGEDSQKLPQEIEKGSSVDIENVLTKQHFTQPPNRFSEATLVKELEEKEIGRPSTYVPILKTIRDRLYTELDDKKRFVATSLGFNVYQILQSNITKIMDYSFTAEMEKELDKVSQGKMSRNELIFSFYDYLIPTIEAFLSKKITKEYEDTKQLCPLCEKKLVVKMSKKGDFIGCVGFPECKFTANFEKTEDGEIKILQKETKDVDQSENETGLSCEKCGKKMIKKYGRFGQFIACSGYPECNSIYQEKTQALCPVCHNSPLHKKSWKGKIFWGCGAYPKCKFAINGEIIEKTCLVCGYEFAKKTGECLNKDCQKETN